MRGSDESATTLHQMEEEVDRIEMVDAAKEGANL
jgi:hypothetical protein